jgi:hypothetical protein
MVIKKIGPLSCAKIVGTLYVFVGLLMGVFFSLAAMAGLFASDSADAQNMAPFLGAFIGVGSIILFPIMYGCIGFISALIGAWLYNVLAGVVGGVQLEVQ